MIQETFQQPAPGLQFWTNKNNVRVCRLHYTADPHKDEKWVEKAAAKYPGGKKGSAWQMEMEINPYAYAGSLVYQDFSVLTHVTPPWAIPQDWPAFRAIDPGLANPFCCLWVRVSPEGTFYVYREHYKDRWDIEKNCSAIKALTGREEIEFTVIDPIAMSERLDSGGRTMADQIAEHGIFCQPAMNDVAAGIAAVRSLMTVREHGQPMLKIFSSCENLIRELMGYRYQLLTEQQKLMKNVSEKPMKVNDHACDALRYLVATIPPGYMQIHGMYGTKEQRQLTAHEKIMRRLAMAEDG